MSDDIRGRILSDEYITSADRYLIYIRGRVLGWISCILLLLFFSKLFCFIHVSFMFSFCVIVMLSHSILLSFCIYNRNKQI